LDFNNIVEESADNWQKVIRHPFVEEIFSGELSEDKFKFYLKQDYYYLNQSMRNMAVLISKLNKVEAKQKLIEIIYSEANLEFAKYQELLELYNIEIEDHENMQLTYSNLAYSNYLLAVSSNSSFAEGISALLPCYWIYLKMADYHQEKLNMNQNQIYKDWASVFLDDGYLKLVKNMIQLLEAEIDENNYEKLKYHFNNSVKFEYEFFDDIYQKKIWQI